MVSWLLALPPYIILAVLGLAFFVLGTVEFFAILINQVVGVRSQPREIVAEALHEVSGDQEQLPWPEPE